MAEKEHRGPLYLVTGLILGILLGVFYGWVISPVNYFDITPKSLHTDYKKEYFLLTGLAYKADDDAGRAYARMREMMDPVDINALRGMLEEIEQDPDTAANYDDMRTFVNALEGYISSGSAQIFSQPATPLPDIGVIFEGVPTDDFFISSETIGGE